MSFFENLEIRNLEHYSDDEVEHLDVLFGDHLGCDTFLGGHVEHDDYDCCGYVHLDARDTFRFAHG